MVRSCFICKKKDYFNPEVCFRRFPIQPEERRMWLSIFEMEDDQNVPKVPDICSDHFNPDDIITHANGTRQIKRNVLPQRNAPIFLEPRSVSSESTTTEIEMSPRTLFGTQYDSPQRHSRNRALLSREIEKSHSSSSVSTETASETERLYEMNDELGPSSSVVSYDDVLCPRKAVNVKKRKRGYIGEMTSSDFSTPEKRRKNLKLIKNRDAMQKRKIHNLQMTVRRLKLRMTSLKKLLTYLKEKSLITETSENTIRASLSGPALEIFERMLKAPVKQKYNPALRSFALTLSFYSPKAYSFVRNTFNHSLPHLRTISKWYRSVDGSPGFTEEALKALTVKQMESPKQLLCNLVMDEMSIRKQVEWTGQKFTGYVDIGTNIEGDQLPKAREALVFMLVCLNGSWKIPVGYFLLDGLSATEKAGLVQKCLAFIHESGVIVTSLTFDGAPTNFSMCEKLGADFSDVNNLITWFLHPITNAPIYIYLDACHMIKLVRNCIATQSNIKDANMQEINWAYITRLVEKQNVEGLHAATKIRMRHLEWKREKMKVRLATQTISRSVSDAITFFREDLKCSDFMNSEGTSQFLLQFNNLFDIFNSRNTFAKYLYKRPLSEKNDTTFFEYFQQAKNYILGLSLKGQPIVNSSRKTGFLGFLVCMESLKKMYGCYVTEKKNLNYILTYKLSQDHLELFFGSIRSKGGFNNNPTARQFEASYKRLLVHTEVTGPDTGNTVSLEQLTILTCGSGSRITRTEGENLQESEDYTLFLKSIQDEIKNNYLFSNAWDLTIYVQDVVSYIAGFVVRSIKKCVSCSKCLYLIESDTSGSLLQKQKTYGRLIKASQLVIQICKAAEKFFRFFHSTKNIFNKKIKNLMQTLIINSLSTLPTSVYDLFGDHMFDDEVLCEHPIQLVKLILEHYFKIRIYYETFKNEDLNRTTRIRSINTKVILFRNQ